MNKAARMLLIRSGRKDDNYDRRGGSMGDMRKNGDYDRGNGYRDGNYRGAENHYGDWDTVRRDDNWRYDVGNYPDTMSGDWMPENASRGGGNRRRYDDGRYAPMGMVGEYPYSPSPMRRYPIKADPGMRVWPPMPDGMPYDEPYGADPYRDTNMGFMHHKGYDFEGEGKIGNMQGYAKGRVMPMGEHGRHKSDVEPLTEAEAKEWARHMENEDGTKGAHWTMEQTTKVMKDLKEDFDEIDFWLAMNATYSDLCKEFKKYNIDKPEAYADFAIAFWLCDDDAVEDKLSAYYEYVAKH